MMGAASPVTTTAPREAGRRRRLREPGDCLADELLAKLRSLLLGLLPADISGPELLPDGELLLLEGLLIL
jgi:hypothetical protein